MKFLDFMEDNKNNKINIYCDMDGVVAEYDIGNFDYSKIRPLKSNIKKLEKLNKDKNINLFILSICKTNDIILEKKEWFKKYMPFLKEENMILISKEDEKYNGISSKELKSNFLKEKCNKETINVVIDDDNGIIKYLIKNNENIKIFQVSSLID